MYLCDAMAGQEKHGGSYKRQNQQGNKPTISTVHLEALTKSLGLQKSPILSYYGTWFWNKSVHRSVDIFHRCHEMW